MLARYMLSSCVCPSVCPSQVGVLPRRLNLGSHKQCRTVAQGLVFWRQRCRQNSNGCIPNLGAKSRSGELQSAILDQYLAISQKWCKIWTYLLWNSYVLYWMVLFSVTMSYPNYPKPPHFRHFVSPFVPL